ncbi:MAG: HAD-IIIC family phosphatase [Lachnospiraceae bacterium]|jgi:FkbH-like protein|nr:HAD-IIIC family phosphatase [Lachnospiraceae bacterium]
MDIDSIKSQVCKLPVYDYINILKLARKVSKQKTDLKDGKIKIAVLASDSQQYFVMVLRLFLIKYEIEADIFEGEYDGIRNAVFDNQSGLRKYAPDIVIILSNYRDIHDMPEHLASEEEIEYFITHQLEYYQQIWKRLSETGRCHIFQANIVLPFERKIGNLEANVCCSRRIILQRINVELIKRKPKNVTIVDMEYIAAFVGKQNWFDYTTYFTSKLEYSLQYIGLVCDVYAQQIAALQGKIKKCLVLDLDNTLWGGVVADVGPEGIRIAPDDTLGEAFRYFQQYVLDLKERGVLLAVISKNDDQIAREPFELNENMILKYDDFSAFIANWENKAFNIDIIAQKLNIGTDSFVFFDDNPAEREIVRMYHPEVMVIDVPENVADYVSALESAHPFEWLSLTEDDLIRVNSYKSNNARNELCIQYKNYQDYLLALDMKGRVAYLTRKDIERFTQLINKTNQFNVRTRRYLEADIENMLDDDQYKLLFATLEDRFGKFGMISCVILKREEDQCFIDTWVMSCRVLKRDVEKFVWKKMIETADNWNCKWIVGEYIPTKKNALVKNLYCDLGFRKQMKKNDDSIEYVYVVDSRRIESVAIKESN